MSGREGREVLPWFAPCEVLTEVLCCSQSDCFPMTISHFQIQAAAPCPCPRGLCVSQLSLVSSGCHKEIPWTGWLQKQTFVSHSLEIGKSEIRVPAWSTSGGSPLPGLQTAAFLPCSHMAVGEIEGEGEGESELWSLLIRVVIPP